MDQNTIMTLSIFIFTNIGIIISMFLWVRSEANSDRRELHGECKTLIEAIRQDGKSFQEAIRKEMHDFHTKLALQDQEFKMRLCDIEARNKK